MRDFNAKKISTYKQLRKRNIRIKIARIDFERNGISFLFCFISAVIMPTITIAGYPK